MGADRHEMRQKNRLPPFVPLLIDTLDSLAWRAMSHGAQMLYVALRRRYNYKNHNNGSIWLSQRDAAQELRSHHNEIARWFRELRHYGFIVMMTPGYLGVEGKGKAPRWRLTELGYMKEAPTRDFMRWDGNVFKDIKTKARAGKPSRSVSENRHTSVRENRSPEAKSVPEMAHISSPEGVRENHHRIILPYTSAQQSPQPPTTAPAYNSLLLPVAHGSPLVVNSRRKRERIQNDPLPKHRAPHRQRYRINDQDNPASRN